MVNKIDTVASKQVPFFSIVVPTCGRPGMLERAIGSLVAQGFTAFEIVVVDDRPTAEPLSLSCLEHDSVRYIQNTGAHGVANARNLGIDQARAEWVLFLDDDDELADDYLTTLHHAILADADVEFFWSGVRVFYADSDKAVVTASDWKTKEIKLYKDDDATYIGASYGVALKRSVFQRCGNFDVDFPVGEDTELFVRVMSEGIKARAIPHIGMIKHETHVERLSTNYTKYADLNIYERIFRKHRAYLADNRKVYHTQLCWASLVYINNGNFSDTKYFFQEFLTLGHYWSYFNMGCYRTVHYMTSTIKKWCGLSISRASA